jgi:hypothetical protein
MGEAQNVYTILGDNVASKRTAWKVQAWVRE